MSYIKKAGEHVAIVAYLLESNQMLSSGTRQSIVRRLEEAISLLNHPMPASRKVLVRQTTERRSCGVRIPLKVHSWYFRVEMALTRDLPFPECYAIVGPQVEWLLLQEMVGSQDLVGSMGSL